MTIEASDIIVWVLVFLRTGAFFMGIPLFAGKMIPVRFRLGFGLLLAILVNPLVPANVDLAHHFIGAILLAMNEGIVQRQITPIPSPNKKGLKTKPICERLGVFDDFESIPSEGHSMLHRVRSLN